MCGIFGVLYANPDTIPDTALLRSTAGLIGHRGPDSVGLHAARGVGFAHTRLSLLDLSSRSDQPLWDRSGRYCVVYNGEIYNHAELRAGLERQGVHFNTTSDTEVLLYSLIHSGPDVLPRLEGMFAFAFYDQHTGALTLGRDRFGIKPLYLYQDDRMFLFASEVKAMAPWTRLDPDLLSISSYLQGFGGPTLGHTFYRGIRSMDTGSTIEVRHGQAAPAQRFFSLPGFRDPELHQELATAKPARVVDRMEELLFASVRKHLVADTPVGALCSGGVDSSLLMAMAARVHNNLAIFHANVVGPHSEFDAAAALAKHLRLDLKHVDVEDRDFLLHTPQVTHHYGHPFSYHANSVAFLQVTRLVQSHGVKAVLTGEGADECFLGYDHLPNENLVNRYERAIDIIGRAVRRIPGIGRILWPGSISQPKLVTGLHNRFEVELERAESRDILGGRVSPNDLKTIDCLGYHLRTLLHRNDTLGMAASIEARFPFLDHDLVRFAVNLPYHYKIRREFGAVGEAKHPLWRSKWLLRQVANRYLPRNLSQRPKRGFPTDAFARMRISRRFFDSGFVSELFELTPRATDYLVEQANRSLRVRLLHLEVWGRVCILGHRQEDVVASLRVHVSIAASGGKW
jgi:asparagine synthase (glutamine-hydrolysing)